MRKPTGGNGSGTVTITNDGNVTGDGTSGDPVVQIITDNGAGTLTNESGGTIAPASSSASGLAISASGSTATIYNYGTIFGEVALSDATFNNESTGVWDVAGPSTFNAGSTVNNAGTINAIGNTAITDPTIILNLGSATAPAFCGTTTPPTAAPP